jgi:hypothetical protein
MDDCIDLAESSQEPDDFDHAAVRTNNVVDLDSSYSSNGSIGGSGTLSPDDSQANGVVDLSLNMMKANVKMHWKRNLVAMGYSTEIADSACAACESLEAAVDFALNHSVVDDSPVVCVSTTSSTNSSISSSSSSGGSSSGGSSSGGSSSMDEALAKELQEKEELKAKLAVMEAKLKTAQQQSTHAPRPRYWASGGRGSKHVAGMQKGVQCVQLTEELEEYQAVLSQFNGSASGAAGAQQFAGSARTSMDVTKIHRIECDAR